MHKQKSHLTHTHTLFLRVQSRKTNQNRPKIPTYNPDHAPNRARDLCRKNKTNLE